MDHTGFCEAREISDQFKAHYNIDDDLSHTKYNVFKRPYFDYFLSVCREHYQVGVWSAGLRGYVDQIVENGFDGKPLSFVLAREHCTDEFFKNYPFSNVKVLGNIPFYIKDNPSFSVNKALLLDDLADIHGAFNPGLVQGISPWYGDPSDTALLQMAQYLTRVAKSTTDIISDRESFNPSEPPELPDKESDGLQKLSFEIEVSIPFKSLETTLPSQSVDDRSQPTLVQPRVIRPVLIRPTPIRSEEHTSETPVTL